MSTDAALSEKSSYLGGAWVREGALETKILRQKYSDKNTETKTNTTGGLGRSFIWKAGASEGIRTLDIHLGKVTLYQTELHSR